MTTSDSFSDFLSARRSDLRRIAARTQGEHSIHDVEAEAWLIADEMSKRRRIPVDFHNPDDQAQILARLHCRLVRFAEKTVRYAVKLDKDWDDEDADSAAEALARLLTAPEHFNPLVQLLDEESRFDPIALVRHSYSQAAAYVILLHRFDWELEILAEQLQLAATTLRAKVAASGVHMRNQPSLFDRIHSVAQDFIPKVGRRFLRSTIAETEPQQLDWERVCAAEAGRT